MAHDWLKIRTDYFGNRSLTLFKLAEKYNIPLQVLKNKCAEEKWVDKKKEVWAKAEQKVTEALPESIAQVKIRHVRIARAMQARAIEKIKSDKIVSKSTYTDLATAIEIERDALGLNDKKQSDEQVQKLMQFNFIFSLKPDELRRFIKSAITRGVSAGSGNGNTLPAPAGETK